MERLARMALAALVGAAAFAFTRGPLLAAPWLGLALASVAAVAMIPVPSCLVRTRASPARAPVFVSTRAGSISPVTAYPNLISRSLTVWPPSNTTPASRSLSKPPRKMAAITSGPGPSFGSAAIASAVRGSPPIA